MDEAFLRYYARALDSLAVLKVFISCGLMVLLCANAVSHNFIFCILDGIIEFGHAGVGKQVRTDR